MAEDGLNAVELAEVLLRKVTVEDEPEAAAAEIAANAKVVALLEKVANNKNQTIIFLLRSDSLGTYRLVKKLCDDNDVRNGKLPAVGNGRLDLRHFRDK